MILWKMYDSEALFLETEKSILFVDFLFGYSYLIFLFCRKEKEKEESPYACKW
jgi:hypothetical protein